MPTAPTPVDLYDTPPSSSDPANFDTRADAKVLADQARVPQMNALGENVYANALEAVAGTAASVNAAAAASASAIASATYAGASVWVSGTYAADVAARSPSNHRIYIARTSGAKPTDPALDPTNWGPAAANDLQLIEVNTTTATAAPGGCYALLNAAASTLTAPAAPQQGDSFGVKVANGRPDNLVNWNGAKHENLSDTAMKLHRAGLALTFKYINAAYGWGIF